MSIINDKFPGRSDYVGPKVGWFGLLHHGILFEESHDVMERIDYVGREKPKGEIAIRLHNMIYLGAVADTCAKRAPLYADYQAKRNALDADYKAKRAPLYADYQAKCDALYADYQAKRAPLYADYEAKRDALYAEIFAYISTNIPDCAWNGTELVFTTKETP